MQFIKNIALKKSHFYTLIIFITVFSGWLFVLSNPIKTSKAKPQNPNSFITNVTSTEYELNGNLKRKITATTITQYQKNESAIFTNPHLITYENNRPKWDFSSQHGKSLHGRKEMFFWDNVKAISNDLKITTTKITVFPDESYAITHEPVTIRKPKSIIHANGMRVDLNTGDISLLSQTKGSIATS